MDDQLIAAKKSLGQHWLRDQASLKAVVDSASITKKDTVLEIGPGLGTLTELLVEKAHQVVAIELDEALVVRLNSQFAADNLIVKNENILRFDLGSLPKNYKVAANIPYYITGHLLRLLTETLNPPQTAVLLVQKEVAQRLASKPGDMNIISVALQLDYEVSLGKIVKAEKFTPSPKVDSQIIKLARRSKPLFENLDKRIFMQVVKAGFSARRKKLRSSLAGGLQLDKNQVEKLLKQAKVSGDLRAQNLSLPDWHKLYIEFYESTHQA